MTNTMTPESYNIETAYQIVMHDCGSTYLGDFAKSWNKQVGALFLDLCVYAQRNQLPNPATVLMMEKPKTSARVKPIIKKSPSGSFTIAQTRLEGTPLESANEIKLEVDGNRVYLINASDSQETSSPVEEAKQVVMDQTVEV